MLSLERVSSMGRCNKSIVFVVMCVGFCPFGLSTASAQESTNGNYRRPTELEAVDPEIRSLLDKNPFTCEQFNIDDAIARVQKALNIADSRGLIGDRALAETILASAYIGQAEMELAFTTFQKALQDASEAKNVVLEADILTSLASEAQLKGNVPQAIELTSRALRISEKSGSLYEKARALGELGRMKLLLGNVDEAIQSIDEALKIDTLNGYRFQALHLVYRGYYLGVTQKPDQAIDSLAQAKTKALVVRDAYSFIMAENSYAFGLVKKGRADEAITELMLIKQGDFQKFIQDSKEQACLASALQLPVLHLTLLEGLTNVLEAANQKERELEIWQEAYSFSHDHGIVFGEAEAAQKAADLNNQLKKTDDALKYYAVAAELYHKLQNEPLLAQVQVSLSLLLIQVGRGKEAIPLEQDVASYAKRHSLRLSEFLAYGVLAEIYQPSGNLELAREELEKALSLVQPGPFDGEIDNHLVLEDYTRLSDIYRALKIPTKELLATEKAFVTARALKDEKAQQYIVTYLDQRLSELRVRELAGDPQKDAQPTQALLYSYILLIRDGAPSKPQDDDSNWNRVLTLPFQIAQKPGGAPALVELLGQIESLVRFEKLPILNALERYYIASGSDPVLAEKYVLQAEELLKDVKVDMTAVRVECSCVLAIAYSRQGKTSLANDKIAECLSLSNKTNDKQSVAYAEAANAMVQLQNGNIAAARGSLEKLIAKAPEEAELHVELATSLASAKLYDDANSQLDLAIAKFTSAGDKKTAARAYTRVSIALNADSSERAQKLQLRYLNSARQLFHDLQAQAEEAETLVGLGDYWLRLIQTRRALDNYEKAYNLAQKAGNHDVVAEALLGLGNAYQAERDFTRASEFHAKAAATYHQLKNDTRETISLRNLAHDYFELGETDRALSSFLEAKRAAKNSPALNKYFVDYGLGDFYRSQGQFERALASFKEAIDITSGDGDLEHCAYSHLAVASLNTVIGGWDDATSESELALSLFQKIGNKEGQAACWALLTGVYSDRSSSLKNFEKAQECYRKAREFGYGKILELDLMEIHLQTGKYSEAARIASESIQDCLKARDTDCQAHGLLSLSEAKRLNGELRASRSALNEARPLASKSQEIYLRGRLLYAEARLLTSEGKLEEAQASYKQLITLIEAVKGKLDAREQKSLSENYGYIYDELVALLYSMSKRDSHDQLRLASESFEYAEINKARQFAESWGRTFVNQMQRSLPPSVQETERSLFSKRDRILSELNVSAVSGELSKKNQKDSTEGELAAVQKDIASFLQELRRKSPQYAAVAYPEPIQISELSLGKGETLVEFKMTDDSTFVWIVQNRSGKNELVFFYKVPQTRTWFFDRISLLRRGLNSGHPEAIDWKVSEDIFVALFPGAASSTVAEAQEIIFIPDDVLFALPFELFSPHASKGDFVFLRKPSTYYPSAVSLRLSRTANHPSKWQEGFLGLADPITSPEDDRFEAAKAIVPTSAQSPVRNGDSREDQVTSSLMPERLKSRGFSFDRLPGTAIEVRNIAALLRKMNEKVEVRVGIDATKNELLDTDLSKFRFLHFATHGVLPVDTNVREPALVLSFDGVAPSHMFLSMSEILGLKLQSESVVLSACNTGSGSISKAEGVMSLGRAFLAAGSSSVTVSLWQVSDESTAVLMEEYYRGLLSGKKKSVALADARTAIVAKGFKDPFFWAPFIVIGE